MERNYELEIFDQMIKEVFGNTDFGVELLPAPTKEQFLIRYPKDENGNTIGCFYAEPVLHYNESTGDWYPRIMVGWSCYAIDKEDKPFNKRLARTIAIGRAMKGTSSARMPDRMLEHLSWFLHCAAERLPGNEMMVVGNILGEMDGE
jgi:hypothetical protein